MSYRDTATALAQRMPENFVGVVLYVELSHADMPARWNTYKFPRAAALEDWYEEIAGSPTLYYYIAAFDKARDPLPVGESTAPPKPGQPGFDINSTWRHSPYRRATISGNVDVPSSSASEVAPGLFVGSKPPPGRREGVDVIVLAAMEYQPPADLFPGTEVIYAPLDDDPRRLMREDEIAEATKAASRVARRLRAGRRVLVTCAMGLNRSALIAALAMHEIYGMGPDEIIARLRRARGVWALSNPNFEKLLRVVIDVRRAS